MALPPAHFLVGAGIGELTRGPDGLARWQVWAAGGLIALLPDTTTMVLFAMGERAGSHGMYTHTLLAVALVAAVGGVIGGWRWALLAGAAYGSHLLVDLLRAGTASVYLLWPLSDQPAQGIYPLFPTVPFEAGGGILGEAPGLYGSRPVETFVAQTLVGAGFFAVALFMGTVLRSSRDERSPRRSRRHRRPSVR